MSDLAVTILHTASAIDENSSALTSRQMVYVKQMEGVIIALGGAELVEGFPTKDGPAVLYANCVAWAHGNRLNHELKTELQNREHELTDWFKIELLNGNMIEVLKGFFPQVPTPEKVKEIAAYWDAIKKDCRNLYGPLYEKDYIKLKKSGSYTDSDVLLNIIKNCILARINDNQKKAMNSFKNSMIGEDESKATDQQKQTYNEKVLEKEKEYSLKKLEWKKQALPKTFLAFLFLSLPSTKDLNCLKVIHKEVVAKTRDGRKALRDAKKDFLTPSTGSTSINNNSNSDLSTNQTSTASILSKVFEAKQIYFIIYYI